MMPTPSRPTSVPLALLAAGPSRLARARLAGGRLIGVGRLIGAGLLLATGHAMTGSAAHAETPALAGPLAGLVAAYPDHLDRVEGGALVWKDGTRMPVDDGRSDKPHEVMLATASIADMFRQPYAAGRLAGPPALNFDPGRARNAALFDKMYGDCAKGGVSRHLVDVTWLPKKWGKPIKLSRVNGAAERLAAVSRELDQLPATFDKFLFPPAGTYNCRPIAGTSRMSAHGHGIAIDISTAFTDYWRWAGGKAGGAFPYKNRIPEEIVAIFERHGFIWGGKWYHYDTMHFEYRPELLPR